MKSETPFTRQKSANLTFADRRLISYIAGKKSSLGALYLKSKIESKRMVALKKLIHAGILEVCEIKNNIVYVKITQVYSFLKEKKQFNHSKVKIA